MSIKTCLPLIALLVAGICVIPPPVVVSPILHLPTACVQSAQANASVSGSKITLVKYHDQRQSLNFDFHLKTGQHKVVNVVVVSDGKRYVLRGTVCRVAIHKQHGSFTG